MESIAPQDVTIWPGDIGEWKAWQVQTNDTALVACGAELQVEDYVGIFSDDTAVNGLRLVMCGKSNWEEQTMLDVFEGRWGGWKGVKLCPKDSYVDGAQVQYEDLVGSIDATGINGLRIHCSNNSEGVWLDVHTGRFGSYRDAVVLQGGRVIGASVRYHDPCGTTCDDTALNGVLFRFLGGEVKTSGPTPTAAPTSTPAPEANNTPSRPPSGTAQSSSPSIAIAVVSSVAVVFLIAFSLLFAFCLCRRHKETKPTQDDTLHAQEDLESAGNIPNGHSPTLSEASSTINPTQIPPVVSPSLVVAEVMAKPNFKDQVNHIEVATAVAVE